MRLQLYSGFGAASPDQLTAVGQISGQYIPMCGSAGVGAGACITAIQAIAAQLQAGTISVADAQAKAQTVVGAALTSIAPDGKVKQGGACNTGNDCEGSLLCSGGICGGDIYGGPGYQKGCGALAACPSGQTCVNDQCVVLGGNIVAQKPPTTKPFPWEYSGLGLAGGAALGYALSLYTGRRQQTPVYSALGAALGAALGWYLGK
jgi:hypothetical protein